MSDFVYDATSLPGAKIDMKPLAGPANQNLTAAEMNTITAAIDDLRSAILAGQYHGLANTPAAGLSASGAARFRLNGSALELSINGGAYTGVLSTAALTPAAWIAVVGGVGFKNSWANTGGQQAAQFSKDPIGRVHIRGVIDTGSVPSVAFTLPAGYRPPTIAHFAVISNSDVGYVTVDTNGDVAVLAPSAFNCSLFGISFSTVA